MISKDSRWRSESLSRTYLEGVRGAIPLADAQIDIMLKIVEQWRPDPDTILDLGCGDGILGRALLDRFSVSRALFVDFSQPMLDSAKKNLEQYEQTQIKKLDYASPNWLEALPAGVRFDVIVSGFSIHHQPDSRKKTLYQEIYELMSEGGLFLNLEHVASSTPALEAVFDDYFIDHLYAYHLQAGETESREVVNQRCYARPDKTENILTAVDIQCNWLREIGFADVDCYFKVFELALFGGRKQG